MVPKGISFPRAGLCAVSIVLTMFFAQAGLADGTQDVDDDELVNMTLEELLQVDVVTAGKKDEPILDIPASVVLLTRDDIERYGFSEIPEIIEHILGYRVFYDYGFRWMGVRGFLPSIANKNVLILINGIAYEDEVRGNRPFVMIPVPVEAIDRIEVIRGPMSVLYGSGASFGVINIITGSQEKMLPQSMIAVSAGTNGIARFVTRLENRKDDFYYSLNAAVQYDEGVNWPLKDITSAPLSIWNLPDDARTRQKLENNSGFFGFHSSYKSFTFDFTHSRTNFESMFLMPTFSDGHLSEYDVTRAYLTYESDPCDTCSLMARFGYFSNTKRDEFDFLFDKFFGEQYQRSEGIEAEIVGYFRLGENIHATLGAHQKLDWTILNNYNLPSFGVPNLVNVRISLAPENNMTQRAVFSQLDYTATDWLKIIAGIRLEHLSIYDFERATGAGTAFETWDYGRYDVNQVEIIPRMALIFTPQQTERIKIMYGQATNRPSFFQNYQTILEGFPTLKPEVVHTFEINYLSAYSKNLTIGTSYFHNVFDNLIVRTLALDLTSDMYISYSSNDGKMVTDGFEVLIKAKPNSDSIVEIAGTYQHTRDRREGWENREVPYSPNFLGYFKASYNITDSICLALTANYVSSMESQWNELKINADGTRGGRVGKKVEGNTIATCNIRIDGFLVKGGYLNLHIYNLFKSEIRYPTHTNSLWADKGTIGKGRTILFTMGKSF